MYNGDRCFFVHIFAAQVAWDSIHEASVKMDSGDGPGSEAAESDSLNAWEGNS